MSRYFLRIAIAILCFSIGLFGVWASGYWKSFESFVVENFSEPMPNMPEGCPRLVLPHDYDSQKQAVYIQVLKELIDKDTKVLILQRKNDQYGIETNEPSQKYKSSNELAESFVLKITKTLPQAEEETLRNYYTLNLSSYPLSNLPEMNIPILFSDLDIKTFLKSNKKEIDWSQLHNKFPNGLISLSNVGFNSSLTQAFVYASKSVCGKGCGKGVFFLLSKQQGGWIVENRFVWMA